MKRGLLARCALAAALPIACFDLSGPPSGLSAISVLQLPWPSVVEQDVLRDSTGVPAPLRVDAYDGDGNLVSDATVVFIALDPGLRIDADGTVHGESVRTSRVRVVAQVARGGDVLQTPEVGIDVVPRPDTVTPAGFHTLAVKVYTLTGIADTSWVMSDPINVTVRNRARLVSDPSTAAVRSWIVRYEITARPAGVNDEVTAFFPGAGRPQIAVDTTDPSGLAARQVILRTIVLPPASKVGRHEVKVSATVRERGQNVPGSPIELVIPFEIRAAP